MDSRIFLKQRGISGVWVPLIQIHNTESEPNFSTDASDFIHSIPQPHHDLQSSSKSNSGKLKEKNTGLLMYIHNHLNYCELGELVCWRMRIIIRIMYSLGDLVWPHYCSKSTDFHLGNANFPRNDQLVFQSPFRGDSDFSTNRRTADADFYSQWHRPNDVQWHCSTWRAAIGSYFC